MDVSDDAARLRAAALAAPDPHGHAALLLVESLIHGLLAHSVITTREAIDIVERAGSVQLDVADAAEKDSMPMRRAHGLLDVIAASLRTEIHRSVEE